MMIYFVERYIKNMQKSFFLKKRERKNNIKNKIKLILKHLKLYLVLPLDISKCFIEKIKTDDLFQIYRNDN